MTRNRRSEANTTPFGDFGGSLRSPEIHGIKHQATNGSEKWTASWRICSDSNKQIQLFLLAFAISWQGEVSDSWALRLIFHGSTRFFVDAFFFNQLYGLVNFKGSLKPLPPLWFLPPIYPVGMLVISPVFSMTNYPPSTRIIYPWAKSARLFVTTLISWVFTSCILCREQLSTDQLLWHFCGLYTPITQITSSTNQLWHPNQLLCGLHTWLTIHSP